MRRYLLFGFAALMLAFNAGAQVSNYSFTATTGTYTPITGTAAGLADDGSGYGANDEGIVNGIPIGFTFNYSGANYTTCGISSNGHIAFGTLTVSNFSNNLSTGGTGRPIVAPLWDDMDIQSAANCTYTTTGTAPNRVFTVQWTNVKWGWQATAGCMDFQVKLFETTNVVEFHYNQLGGTLSAASASIGLSATATGSGNFLSLNNATGAPTASSTTSTTTIATKPATGQIYRFSPPNCLAPGGLAASNITPTSATVSWNAVSGATGYEWAVTTSATPPASGTATTATTANATGLSAGSLYYLHVRTNCGGGTFSGWTNIQFSTVPNDQVCNAIALTQGGPQDCQNTVNATSVGDPALPGACSSPNNTVWYSYTPATTGTVLVRTEIPTGTSNGLNGWLAWYTATGTCPAPGLTLTPVAGSSCQEFGQTGAGDVDSLISPVLTAGTTYYIMIDGFSGDAGDFCISLLAPPPPPPCVTNITPANGATGVTSVAGNVTLTWNAATGATGYDVYFGTTNPPTTNIGTAAGTTANITGTSYNTTYYWYVVPRNTGGLATGCQTNTTSFITENPGNCVPSYTTGCTAADSISYFSLKGNSGTVIYNPSGATCSTTPRAYNDYTAAFTPVLLTRTESYSGFIKTGDPNDYISMWIDGDDDGFFEDNERILNNLKGSTTKKLYSIYIPASIPLGTHRLRVRNVYFGTAPTTPTHPCNPYTWGETEDYLVDITNVGTSRSVAPGTPGTCMETSSITVDAASNNNNAAPLHLLDSLNNLVAGLYPNGNNLFNVNGGYYVHNGPVRQDVSGRYYLDRNININVEYLPTTTYNLRYFFRNAELNAMIAQPGSGVTSVFDLVMTKTLGAECVTQYVNQTPTLSTPTGFGSLNGDRFLDLTNISGFSRYFLHGGSTILLPVKLTNFRGQVTGTSNTLYWTTEQEQDNDKFVVERSTDGVNYTVIGNVTSLAPNGNSSSRIDYQFVDANPPAGKAFYRLQMVDRNGRPAASPVVTLRRNSSKLEIVDVRPNPTSNRVYFNVLGGSNNNLNLVVRNLQGQEVMRRNLLQTGNYNIDLSPLAAGVYVLEATDTRTAEKAVFKVVKE